MPLFTKQPEKRLLTPEESAETLNACALIPMDPKNVAAITNDPAIRHSLEVLIYLTKTSITMGWLQRAVEGAPADQRIRAILTAYEELVFSKAEAAERPALVKHIQGLGRDVLEVDRVGCTENSPKANNSGAVLRWCKNWLENISSDDVFLKRTCILFGGSFFAYIHTSTGSLAKEVEAVWYEKQ